MKAILDHFGANKGKYGALLVAVGGWLRTQYPQYQGIGDLIILVGGFLSGAGFMRSDREVKRGQ
jgi:hypothetical protein